MKMCIIIYMRHCNDRFLLIVIVTKRSVHFRRMNGAVSRYSAMTRAMNMRFGVDDVLHSRDWPKTRQALRVFSHAAPRFAVVIIIIRYLCSRRSARMLIIFYRRLRPRLSHSVQLSTSSANQPPDAKPKKLSPQFCCHKAPQTTASSFRCDASRPSHGNLPQAKDLRPQGSRRSTR